jgi:hypothetical protein
VIAVSFLLAAGSIFGLWLVGRNPRIGWAWCLGMEVPWVVYALSIGQPALAVLCAFYAGVYAINLRKTSKPNT